MFIPGDSGVSDSPAPPLDRTGYHDFHSFRMRPESNDNLTWLLAHVSLHAETFCPGPLCGLRDFSADEGFGHLHMIHAGSLRAVQAGSPAIEVREPSLLFYPRPICHRLVIDDRIALDLRCATVHYGAETESTVIDSLPPVMAIPFRADPKIESTLSLMFDEAADRGTGCQVLLDRLCDVLLLQIVRFAVQQRMARRGVLAGVTNSRLGPVLTEMLDDPRRPWTLESMAARAHLSRNAFARQFRDVVGATPTEFLTRVRVELAQRLLSNGRQVSIVAQEVGYNSQPAFSRAFLRESGVCPSAWQRQRISPN